MGGRILYEASRQPAGDLPRIRFSAISRGKGGVQSLAKALVRFQPPFHLSFRSLLHTTLESPTMPLVLEDDVVFSIREAAK